MTGPICRTSLAGGLLLALAVAPVAQAAADHTGKTPKECNAELQKNEAALDAAGESASAFIHACWRSEKGKPTPIAAAAEPAGAKTAEAKPPAAEKTVVAERTPATEAAIASETMEHSARRIEHHRRAEGRREWRQARYRRRARERSYARRSFEAALYSEAERPVLLPPAPTNVLPSQDLPREVSVNLPVVGSITAPILPVPGLAATVRDVVDHPVVPGLVTATP